MYGRTDIFPHILLGRLLEVDLIIIIGSNPRTERPRKTIIGTEVAHATRDSDTTFKVTRSKVNLLLMS